MHNIAFQEAPAEMKLSELRNPRIKRALAEAVVLIAFAAIVDAVFIAQMGVRYLGLANVGVCSVLCLFLVRHHRMELESTPVDAQAETLARHKRAAEVLAALAIGSFAITQYRSGLELDRILWQRTDEHLADARMALRAPSGLCPPSRAALLECISLEKALSDYQVAIDNGNTAGIKATRDRVLQEVDSTYAGRVQAVANETGARLALWATTDQVRHAVAVTDTVDESQARVFIAQYVFLILATLAIARKVATARFDLQRVLQERKRGS